MFLINPPFIYTIRSIYPLLNYIDRQKHISHPFVVAYKQTQVEVKQDEMKWFETRKRVERAFE